MAKPKPALKVRPPPAVDPVQAQHFISTGNLTERPQTSVDGPGHLVEDPVSATTVHPDPRTAVLPGASPPPGVKTSTDVHGRLSTSLDVPQVSATTPHEAPRVEVPRKARRAPSGTKTLVERQDGSLRRRMTIYLPPELAERFTAWCSSRGREVSHAAAEAIQKLVEESTRSKRGG